MPQKFINLALLALGLGLGVGVIAPQFAALSQTLGRVGWGFLACLPPSLLIFLLDAAGWRLSFVPGQRAVAFTRLFQIRMAGEALNRITPLASMGGEPLKGFLLSRTGTRLDDALASVAIAKNTMTIGQIVFIFAGVAAAWPLLPGHRGMLLGLAVFPGIILTAMGVTAVLDLSLRRRRRQGHDPLARLRDGWFRRAVHGAVVLWSQVADFFWSSPRAFFASFAAFFLGWAGGALELVAFTAALGVPLSLTHAFVMEALICSIGMATFFIPGNVGTQEGGLAFLGPLFGLSSAEGLTLALLRRAREAVWITYGLGYLGMTEGRVLIAPPVTDTQ